MPFARRSVAAIALCLTVLLASSCLVRRRVITRAGKVDPNRTLMNASKEVLLAHVNEAYNGIRSFQANADMTPVVGSVYKGQISEYKDVTAVILYSKPNDIRIIAFYPVIRTTAFDMVSTGTAFRLFIPSKNRFVEGNNDAPADSKNALENLRPEAFFAAMMIPPPGPGDIPVLEDDTDEETALYILHILRKSGDGFELTRNIWFDRITLQILRQESFDHEGLIVSDTRYSQWKNYPGGVPFATNIVINRPKDGYGVVIGIQKLEVNKNIAAQKFVLNQPEGAQVQLIGSNPAPQVNSVSSPTNKRNQ